MRKRTHIITGALTSYVLHLEILPGFIVILGSVLPDIDVNFEKLRHKLKLVPSWLTHRGITHWWGLPLIMGLIGAFNLKFRVLLYLSLGWTLHLLTDALTPSGIPVYPFSKEKRFRLLPRKLAIRYNSFGELVFVILITLVAFLIRPLSLP